MEGPSGLKPQWPKNAGGCMAANGEDASIMVPTKPLYLNTLSYAYIEVTVPTFPSQSGPGLYANSDSAQQRLFHRVVEGQKSRYKSRKPSDPRWSVRAEGLKGGRVDFSGEHGPQRQVIKSDCEVVSCCQWRWMRRGWRGSMPKDPTTKEQIGLLPWTMCNNVGLRRSLDLQLGGLRKRRGGMGRVLS